MVAAIVASQDGVARLALPAWAEKQQSREDDRFALEEHRRPPPRRLTGLIGRHRRCVENRLARTGLQILAYTRATMHASEPAPHPAT